MSIDPHIKPPKSFGEHVGRAIRKSRKNRPFSLYLLLAILVVLLLGAQIVYVRDDPRKFALFLALLFVFFFVVIFRAVLDAFDIARRHLREREALLHATFTEGDFADKLGKRVAENDNRSVDEQKRHERRGREEDD